MHLPDIWTCFLQAGLNQPAPQMNERGQLTCKDSLLVGWGGATEFNHSSCAIIGASRQGTSLKVQGCTLSYHPDSKHTREAHVLLVAESAHAALSQCRLIAPAPGNTTGKRCGIGAFAGGTATLVRLSDSSVAACRSGPLPLTHDAVLLCLWNSVHVSCPGMCFVLLLVAHRAQQP
jgi:hypothetical protein